MPNPPLRRCGEASGDAGAVRAVTGGDGLSGVLLPEAVRRCDGREAESERVVAPGEEHDVRLVSREERGFERAVERAVEVVEWSADADPWRDLVPPRSEDEGDTRGGDNLVSWRAPRPPDAGGLLSTRPRP
jgi:hypothetical protein